jgi:hypothetical protein
MVTRRDAIVAATRSLAATTLSTRLPAFLGAQASAVGPGARAGHGLAYHAGVGALVGGDRDGDDMTREQAWFWDGRRWAMSETSDVPPSTSLRGVVSDLERKSVLIFGGFAILGPLKYGPPSGELWELDARAMWHRRSSAGPEPGARHHHAVAFDEKRGRLVLYGGIDTSDRWDQDVWEWDRRRWHWIQTDSNPGERAHHAMAYDSARGVIVLCGGTRRKRGFPIDTWEWDGRTWRQATTEGLGAGDGCRLGIPGLVVASEREEGPRHDKPNLDGPVRCPAAANGGRCAAGGSRFGQPGVGRRNRSGAEGRRHADGYGDGNLARRPSGAAHADQDRHV